MCWRVRSAAVALAVCGSALPFAQSMAGSLESALVYTYVNNPQLNAQRALVRATDEGVPQALAGYRPKASITANAGFQTLSSTIREIGSTTALGAPASYFTQSGHNAPRGVGATITQTLLNGFQTANRTRLAESQVHAARETLRNTEQTVLLSAVTAYMNLLRDTAIRELQRSNLEVLMEQLRQARLRLESGNVTATDVSQAEARLAVGRTQLFAAEANYEGSKAIYRQVIGTDPDRLSAASPVDRFVPHGITSATSVAIAEHPNVGTAQHNVDVAILQVKIAEGALYPTVSIQGTVQKNYETALNALESFTAGVSGQLTVPVYQGGSEYAAIRQAKETQGQRQLDLHVARDQVRANVWQAWAQLQASKSSIESTKAQVKSAEAALNGVREEARLGQRTTLDVLNAQQELVSARIAMVSAQRDRVVNSYTLLAAIGRLSPQALGLSVPAYDATVHYHQVRDAWAGVRTPDGR
jgi:outer membrane protein